MKKPENYMEMSTTQLKREARKLLAWNCNQQVFAGRDIMKKRIHGSDPCNYIVLYKEQKP